MSKIEFTVGVGVRGPIAPGQYTVGNKSIEVSYPPAMDLGFVIIEFPKSLSTLFVVSWEDGSGKTVQRLEAKDFERQIPIYEVLAAISELLLAFKLARVGHSDGHGIRTIGIGDTLMFCSSVDGKPTGYRNVGLKNYEGNNAWVGANTYADLEAATALALPHIGNPTAPVARKYVRCFELLEHGFYSEAFIVAFSILDDFTQQMLHEALEKKGLSAKSEREELLRGIKESRMKLYLGPILKLACGKSIEEMWPDSRQALDWMNSKRNKIAHGSEAVDFASAAKAIYACLKTLVTLRDAGMVQVDIPVTIFRHAKITASWTLDAPAWVPKGKLAESMDFNS